MIAFGFGKKAHSVRLFLGSLVLLAGLPLSAPAVALDGAVSLALMRYDSRERDNDGATLNRESGWLPALSANLWWPLSDRWSLRFAGEVARGSVDYDGQTQLGVPFRSTTDIDLYRAGAALHYCTAGCWQRFHLGIEGYLRQRDIQGQGGVSSLYEEYRWGETSLGVSQALQRQSPQRWRLRAELFYLYDAQLEVDLRFADYGRPVIALPDSHGYRLAVAFRASSTAPVVSLGYEHLRIDESGVVVATSPAGGLAVSEPASEAEHWRLAVTLPF